MFARRRKSIVCSIMFYSDNCLSLTLTEDVQKYQDRSNSVLTPPAQNVGKMCGLRLNIMKMKYNFVPPLLPEIAQLKSYSYGN